MNVPLMLGRQALLMNQSRSGKTPLNHSQSTNSGFRKVAAAALFSVFAASALHATPVVVDANSLSIAPNGTLNMDANLSLVPVDVIAASQNGLVVRAANPTAQAANIANIRGWINTGFNGGLWDGVGITSKTANADAQVNGLLAVMLYDNNQLGFTNFDGRSGFEPDFNQVFVRMTFAGDYDASGVVDSGDYGLLDFYLGSSLTAQGDINADSVIDPGDYGLLDFVLGAQSTYGDLGVSFVPPPAPAVAVPEPVSVSLLLGGALGLLSIRRRK